MLYASSGEKALLKKHKKVAIGKVEVYDTPYTVPSHGFRVEFYEGGELSSNTLGTLKYTGYMSQIMCDWGEGAPGMIRSTPYQVVWKAFFYARFTGTYTFTVRCPSETEVAVFMQDSDGVHPDDFAYGQAAKKVHKEKNASDEGTFTFPCTAGEWYPIRVDFWCEGAPAHITLLYLEPDGVKDADGLWSDNDSTGAYHNGTIVEEHKVISAGAVNYSEEWENRRTANFLKPVRIPIQDLKTTEKLSNITEMTFDVPIDVFGEENEYFYDADIGEIGINSTNAFGDIRYYNSTYAIWRTTDATLQNDKLPDKGSLGTWTFTDEKQYCDWCYSAKAVQSSDYQDMWYRHKITLESGVDYVFSANVWVESGVTQGTDEYRRPMVAIQADEWVIYSTYDLDECEHWQRLTIPFTSTGVEDVKLMFWSRSPAAANKAVYFTMPKLEKRTVETPQFTSLQQKIRKNRLIVGYMGYQNGCNFASGGICRNLSATGFYNGPLCSGLGNSDCPFNAAKKIDYHKVFVGHVTDFDFSRNETDNKATIRCKSFDNLLKEAIDENYPNTISYLAANYMSGEIDDGSGPNGVSRPRAYDGWMLDKAIRDLCLHAGIDATLLYDREELTTTSGTKYYGDYELGQKATRLRKNSFYGITDYVYPNSFTITDAPPGNAEAEYNWSADFGGNILDRITAFSEAYGCIYGARYNGGIYFKSINTPTFFAHDHALSTFGWTLDGFVSSNDIKAIKGGVLVSSGVDDTATCRVFGSKFQLAIVRGSGYGVPNKQIGIYEDCIQDLVPGGYPECEEGHRCDMLRYRGYNTVVSQASGTYFTFSPNKTIDVDRLEFNLHIGSFYDTQIDWTYNIDLATIGAYPETEEDVLDLNYSVNMLTSGDVRAFNRIGAVQVDVSPVSLTDGTIYVMRIQPNHITPPDGGCWTVGRVAVKAVRGGNKATYIHDYLLGGDNYWTWNNWPDIKFIDTNGEANSTMDILITRVYDSELVNSGSINIYQSGEDWYYYDGVNPLIGYNPCIFTIYSQDLIGQNNQYGYDAADVYDIQIKNLTDTDVKIEALLAYSTDINALRWGFSTTEDVSNLKVDSSPEDVRNDVFVIGALKGPIRNLDGKVLNPNNPEMEYNYSRATDLNSVYQLGGENSVGRERPFILQLPEVGNDAHAHWLAVNTLLKYRLEPKDVSITTQGMPLLAPDDCVGVSDYAESTITLGEPLWIQEIANEISDQSLFTSRFSLTSIEPWESYIEKEEPDMANFVDSSGNEQAFIGVSIASTLESDGYTGIEGYDCYESEQNNYIKISYFQVNNGNVKVFVYPSGSNSERYNIVSIIKPPTEGGTEGVVAEYNEWGYHEILWDGIAWSNWGRPFSEEPGYYVEDGNWCIGFELEKNGRFYYVYTDALPTNDNLNESGEIHIITDLSKHPTAGTLNFDPESCGYTHYGSQQLLCKDEDGWPARGGVHADGESCRGGYWSRPNQVSCADFDEQSVTFTFSASGEHDSIYKDRYVKGPIRIFVTECVKPDIYDPALHEYTTFLASKWGKSQIISNISSEELGGYYNIDRPFIRRVNPLALKGINTQSQIEFDKIELDIDWPTATGSELDDAFPRSWDMNDDGVMHFKAVVIDCSELRDRAGRMIFQRFEYGYGDTWGVGETGWGYRLCRFDRIYGKYTGGITKNKASCGANMWWGGNFRQYADIESNPEYWQDHFRPGLFVDGSFVARQYAELAAFSPPALRLNATCKYSRFSNKDPLFSGGSCKGCQEFVINAASQGTSNKVMASMTDVLTNRYVLNHVIYWHSDTYDHAPFTWLGGGWRNGYFSDIYLINNSRYYSGYYDYSPQNSFLGYQKTNANYVPCLADYFATRVVLASPVINGPGQKILPRP